MLGAGLLARQIVLPVGRRIAARTSRRVPRLASYAIAGTTAALFRSALEAWAGVSGIPLWVSFGLLWGVVAGLLLPLGAPAAEKARDAAAPPAETGP